MSIYKCNSCGLKYSNDQVACHPVSRNKHVCQHCIDNYEQAQADAAKYEDQCDDDRVENND